jgi:hypothetical protein
MVLCAFVRKRVDRQGSLAGSGERDTRDCRSSWHRTARPNSAEPQRDPGTPVPRRSFVQERLLHDLRAGTGKCFLRLSAWDARLTQGRCMLTRIWQRYCPLEHAAPHTTIRHPADNAIRGICLVVGGRRACIDVRMTWNGMGVELDTLPHRATLFG